MALNYRALALVAASAAGMAQSLPELRTDAVPAGSVFLVRNTAAQPLTAYLIELVEYPGSSYTLFQDGPDAAIAPGAEKRIPVTNMTLGAAPEYVKITAAIFGDGSSAGNADRVALIVARRKAILETSRGLIERLEKARASGASKDAVIADFRQLANSQLPQGRARGMTGAAVGGAAARQAIADAIASLGQRSIDETLASLRATEKQLAAAKP
jgi:hypothetical protein